MIKYVFCDMDGTLLTHDKKISERNKEAIRKVTEMGVKFCIATGRIYPAARVYLKELGLLDSPIICCNGATVLSPADDTMLVEHPMPKEGLSKLIDICRKYDEYFHFYNKNTIFAERYDRVIKYFDEFSRAIPEDERIHTEVLDNSKDVFERDFHLYKMGVYFEEVGHFTEMIEEMSQVEGIDCFKSLETMYDFMATGVNKGAAIAELAAKLGVDRSEILCIGDNENDIEMIQYAGIGVAMDNAEDHVKAHADYIAESNMDHGVAETLEKFIIRGEKL